jgi:hypothetical protein
MESHPSNVLEKRKSLLVAGEKANRKCGFHARLLVAGEKRAQGGFISDVWGNKIKIAGEKRAKGRRRREAENFRQISA